MEKTENQTKTQNAEERLWNNYSEKLGAMQTSNSRLFYGTIVVLNIFIVVMSLLYLNSKEKVEGFKVIFENMGVQNILLIVLMFFGVMVLKTIPDYLKVFSKTKKRKFLTCYTSNVKREFYDCVTVYKKGCVSQTDVLNRGKIKNSHAVDVAVSKSIINKVSFTIYGTIFMIIGAFAWVKYIPLYLYLIALVGLIFNFAIICFTLYFGKNKEEAMTMIASVCKFLYNKKIIKDYEKVFYKIVDTLIVYNKAFKYNKIIVCTEIFSNFLIYFLKGLAIYLLCYSINLIEGGILFNILFVWVVMQTIISMWPFQKGTLIFEVLFILLFKVYYFEGYVFWAMVFYRVFDYFMYIVQFLIVKIVLMIAKKETKKGTMQT